MLQILCTIKRFESLKGLWTADGQVALGVGEMDGEPWVVSVVIAEGFPYQQESENVRPFVRGDVPLYVTFLLLKECKLGNPIYCRNILHSFQISEKIHQLIFVVIYLALG